MSRGLPCSGLLLLFFAALTSGCVDRRFIIESDPPGAIVYVNGKLVGATPADLPFTYYGTYRFVFVRDGYETLTVDECISPPWYEYFPLDFFAENLLPYTLRDVHDIRKPLQAMVVVPPEDILRRAEQLRAQGKSIGVPLAPAAPPAGAAVVPPGEVPPPAAVVPVPPPVLPQ
jgi:PEGA domain